MLKQIREKHTKTVLWAITIIIMVTFGLGGAVSYIKSRQNPIIGKIDGKKINASDADYYDKMVQAAKTVYMLNMKAPAIKTFNAELQPGEYLLLVWKTKKEKIAVSDKEIASTIRKWFSINGKFSNEAYNRFLNFGIHMQPSRFEEYVANFIKIDKLYDKVSKVTTTPEEIKEIYTSDTQKAKIGYIVIPYEKYLSTVTPDEASIKQYYEENKTTFKKEPLASFAYITTDASALDTLNNNIPSAKDIKALSAKVNLPVNETDFIAPNAVIGDFKDQPSLNYTAFALRVGEISSALNIANKAVVIQKTGEKESNTASLDEVKKDIVDLLKQRTAYTQAQAAAVELLKKIKDNKISDLKNCKLEPGWEYLESKEFKANDYIEGIGLDLRVNGIAFSLNNKEIHKDMVLLPKGVFVIQLLDKTVFDEEKFNKAKGEYEKYLLKEKAAQAQADLIDVIKEESSFEVFELPKKSTQK